MWQMCGMVMMRKDRNLKKIESNKCVRWILYFLLLMLVIFGKLDLSTIEYAFCIKVQKLVSLDFGGFPVSLNKTSRYFTN